MQFADTIWYAACGIVYLMASIHTRNDPVKLFWRRLAMLALCIFILFALWAVIGVFQKERESQDLRKDAEAQLRELQKREIALKARIESLETERGQEAALRDAYGVGREGEGMVQIVDRPATTSEQYGEERVSWFQRLFWWW